MQRRQWKAGLLSPIIQVEPQDYGPVDRESRTMAPNSRAVAYVSDFSVASVQMELASFSKTRVHGPVQRGRLSYAKNEYAKCYQHWMGISDFFFAIG